MYEKLLPSATFITTPHLFLLRFINIHPLFFPTLTTLPVCPVSTWFFFKGVTVSLFTLLPRNVFIRREAMWFVKQISRHVCKPLSPRIDGHLPRYYLCKLLSSSLFSKYDYTSRMFSEEEKKSVFSAGIARMESSHFQ